MKSKIFSLYSRLCTVIKIVQKRIVCEINAHYNAYIDIAILLLVVGTIFDIDPQFQSRFLSFLFQVLILIGFKSVLKLLKAQEQAQTYDFPTVRKRFTKKANDGNFVYIKNSDYYQAVRYLCELEDYFERTGFARWL